MSRYRGPRLRITRRLGDLPGLTRKSAKRAYPPGQHGQARRKRSEYAIRLEEKQKLRFNYGIRERKASKKLAEGNLEFPGLANIPPHLEFDKAKLSAKVSGRIEREWVALEINELLVVEFYSRKV
jgi:ribosomal protein S4